MVRLGAVEGGGTTWVAAIAVDSPENIIERMEFPTVDSSITLGRISLWLKSKNIDALGVASFGPIDANTSSSTYGYITSTPKPGHSV